METIQTMEYKEEIMKSRKVTVTLELDTTMPIKDLKKDLMDNVGLKPGTYPENKDWEINVVQVQANVIKD
jgi:hypothetical protein